MKVASDPTQCAWIPDPVEYFQHWENIRGNSARRPVTESTPTPAAEPERAAAEKAELDVIAQWLPALASEDVVRGWIQSLIDDGNTNPGKLMGLLMKDHKDELDGKLARELCNEMCG